MTLRTLWYRYVNSDHFVIGSGAVWISSLTHLAWWVAPVVLLVGGFIREWLDGDLFATYDRLGYPWEGLKDWAWFLVPLLWRVV